MKPHTSIFRLLGLTLALVGLTFSAVTSAAERGTSRQAKVMLDNAVHVLEQQGPKQAFAKFNDPQGGFIQNDLYIFAIDMDGVYQATGANPKLVGQSLAQTTDAAGKPIGREILTLADKIGYGIIEYEWLNRHTNDVEHKFSRIRKVGDYVLGVGFYLPNEEQ
ncbi:histidine kinase [Motiliproteus coralliicola]|uniref:Histidine kinase n=1 Tax=Motiliproteus coralliicola TaxID=2283196 RepID=A0A369WSM5_9GAMM|nr:cache domain-containing protein [Motiliproteus coralliicola]RDE25100.1 histidine kinase [Motiliproteus coralliicola]